MIAKKENKNNENNVFWMTGEGMGRRCHNINTFVGLIREGKSFNEIARIARKYFTFKKINEYYEIAFDEVNNSDKITESATDYMKKKQAEKEVKK